MFAPRLQMTFAAGVEDKGAMKHELAPKQEIRRRKKELMVRYAYQFRALRRRGLAVPPGWLDLFEQLCHEIDQALTTREKRSFYWTDVKARLGTLRMAWAGYRSALRLDRAPEAMGRDRIEGTTLDLVTALIRKAEKLSEKTCLFCGRPGRLRAGIGWATTTCEEHKDTSYGYLTDL